MAHKTLYIKEDKEEIFERLKEREDGSMAEIADGFFETRRDVYTLYPLLVHVRLFGEEYLDELGRTLERIGY